MSQTQTVKGILDYNRSASELASFPGLHAQLLSLAVRKAGEGLDGFIT